MASAGRDDIVLAFIEDHRDQLIEFTCDLVRTRSTNPPGDERAVAALLMERMNRLGLPQAQVVAKDPIRPNLLLRVPGRTGHPVLMFNGHTDTKPVSDEDRAQWNSDPLEPVIKDGILYGLGSADMKGPVAAIVFAAAAVNQLEPSPQGDLVLALTADEEATTGYGAKYLVEQDLFTADAGMVAEPNGVHFDFENLPLFSRGTFYFKVKVHGTQMHASISDQLPAVNASTKMAWVLWRMSRDLKLSYEPNPLCPQGPTITPGVMVNGGVYYGVHPGYAEFAVDIRLVPGMTKYQVQTEVESFLNQLAEEDPELHTELEVIGGSAPPMLNGDEPFVGSLLAATERVLGRRLPFGSYPAFTDAFHFQSRAGIPTVPAFGPGRITVAHSPNESISVESIVEASKIYALAALEYLDPR